MVAARDRERVDEILVTLPGRHLSDDADRDVAAGEAERAAPRATRLGVTRRGRHAVEHDLDLAGGDAAPHEAVAHESADGDEPIDERVDPSERQPDRARRLEGGVDVIHVRHAERVGPARQQQHVMKVRVVHDVGLPAAHDRSEIGPERGQPSKLRRGHVQRRRTQLERQEAEPALVDRQPAFRGARDELAAAPVRRKDADLVPAVANGRRQIERHPLEAGVNAAVADEQNLHGIAAPRRRMTQFE